MNIFVLDLNPRIAAQFHCDKHVVKMITETAQILSTAFYIDVGYKRVFHYQPTHHNHPCTLWALAHYNNRAWLADLGRWLIIEYIQRYNKIDNFQQAQTIFLNHLIVNYKAPVSFVLAMPDKYKSDDPVESYRNYYLNEKAGIAKWEYSLKPWWWTK